MHRIQPALELEPDAEENAASKKNSVGEWGKVTTFTWNVAIGYFEKKMMNRLGKANIYFLDDGLQIKDESYLSCVTAEICREFGFELLDIMTDLILPVGFGYPSLTNALQDVVDDAFKPVSKAGHHKTVVWIEDEHWNTSDSIVEPIVMNLLLEKSEPFLIAPMKYFDKEVLSTVFKLLDMNADTEPAATDSVTYWKTFSVLLKFGFLLALRSSIYPLILIHLSQKLSEMVDGFQMLDLAEAEGHEVKYFKNAPSNSERNIVINSFVKKLISPGSSKKRIRLELNSLNDPAES